MSVRPQAVVLGAVVVPALPAAVGPLLAAMDVEADVEILDQAELAESAQSLLQQMNADSESSASQENVGWKCKLYDWDVDTPAGWRDAGTGFLFVDLRLETAREVQEQHGSQQ